ncbi:MAG: glycyl-radical enzyme activating protein [Syntrophaceae bacterium]|nr:glycyl-radical enzyme activating protein [Syntrophaceae bacterium]
MTQNEIKTPLILEIKGNSLDDGPGIRSVIFYKGCPLSCVWCHNPESKKVTVEISFDPKSCIDCGSCREVCPKDALSRGNRFYINRNKCDLCFLCVDVCPSGALERVGKAMTVDDILKKILPDKPFFDTSGGGVTLSGGEPTLFMDFTSQLLKSLKQNKINTLMETCGFFDRNRFLDMLYPYLDIIYFDIKIMDSAAHKKYCGIPNEKILDNFIRLYQKAIHDGKILLPRVPLIPDITDTETNIRGIASFLRNLNITEAALLAYNPLWHEKSDKVGADDPYKNSKVMTSFVENSITEKCKAIFRSAGINEAKS